jgi:hypothetical protein
MPWGASWQVKILETADYRKRIETVGSLLERMLPKTIHAVTAEGFELKVFLLVLAYSINCL